MEYELATDDDDGLVEKRKTRRVYSPRKKCFIAIGVAVGAAVVVSVIVLGVSLGVGLQSGGGSDKCKAVETYRRFDCLPGRNTDASECSRRGCCWDGGVTDGSPQCFYPDDYVQGYEVSSVHHYDVGPTILLSWLEESHFSPEQFPYPGVVNSLAVKALFETNKRLHVKVRWTQLQRA